MCNQANKNEHLVLLFLSKKKMFEYFRPSPRSIYGIDDTPVELEAPPEKQSEEVQGKLMAIGPAFTMAIPMVLGMIISMTLGKSKGNGSESFKVAGIITAVSSALLGVIWGGLNLNARTRRIIENEKKRRQIYENYVNQCEAIIRDKYYRNRNTLRLMNPCIREKFTEGNENYKYSDFISDNRYAYLSSSCELTIIDVAKKSEESFKLGHDDYSFVSACNVSANKKFVIIAEMNSVIVFDLIDKKEVANFELPNSAKAVAINNDGSKAFAADMNSGITVVDVKSGKINNEFCVSAKCDNIVESSKGLAFSQDETKLAVVCYDSKVRIVDTATGDIISEIDCPLYGDAFVSFGLNEDDIIVQGGDYTFRVYSMATKELKYEETEIFDSLEKITYDEENNTLALKTTSLVILKDPVDYSTKSAVDSGRIYLKDRVIASDGKDIYSFKLLSKDELVKLAKDTVGRELTDREKVKYHVE